MYTAYGFFINQKEMADKCPTAILAGASEIKDHRLVFRGGNAEALATIEPHKGGTVPVLLWEITPADEAALDSFHGTHYRKEQIKVRLDGRTVSAMLYIMEADGQPLAQPSAYYYATIRGGYTDAGFDEKIIRQSLADSVGPEDIAVNEEGK